MAEQGGFEPTITSVRVSAAGVASKLIVMDFDVRHVTARLTPPAGVSRPSRTRFSATITIEPELRCFETPQSFDCPTTIP